MPSSEPLHVAIVGGGIGGLCMAIGLLRQGVSCKVYEAAPAFGEIGAGVSFGPNSLKAMKLIDPRIYEAFEKQGTVNGWPEKRETWFDFRTGQDTWTKDGRPAAVGTHIADVKAENTGQYAIHRAHFLDELVHLIPKDIPEFGKRLVDVKEEGDKMTMTFQDGTEADADIVIGCDGIKSRTRQILLGEGHGAAEATFTGKYAYRALVPMDVAVRSVGDELARNSQMYMGHHGHVLTFPVEKGDLMNVVAFRTKPNGKWESDKWVITTERKELLDDFAHWSDHVKSIIALIEKFDVWALFDHPAAPTYYRGRLCLLGDSAHASTPHQGAGAGQAIEDGYVLSVLLGQASSRTADIEKAFKAYDMVRRPRSQRVVTTSRDAAALYEMEDPSTGSDVERTATALQARCRWIWDYDIERQLKEVQHVDVR